MRSRYAAFVARDAAYLQRTCHARLRADYDARGLQASFALDWCGLEIVAVSGGGPGDRAGMVHFRAWWRDLAGVRQCHDERSRFVREAGGAWVYRDALG
jgi:SEC-C motif-containing protein